MDIFLSFAPFIIFAVLNGAVGSVWALLAAAVAAAGLIGLNVLRGRSPKILDGGALLLFLLLAGYLFFAREAPSVVVVKLLVDIGMLAIVLVSILIRKPFTIQYAKEQVPREYWNAPRFIRVNYVITLAWAAAFVAIILAEAAIAYLPGFPTQAGVVVTIAALVAAIKFTTWYPKAVAPADPPPAPLPR